MGRSRKKAKMSKKSMGALIFLILIILVISTLVIFKIIDKNHPVYHEPTDSTEGTIEATTEEKTTKEVTTEEVTTMADKTAPVISGVQDISSETGDPISYKTGITVTDDMDPSPTLTVDNAKVDINTPGVYEIAYIATDASGNSTIITAKVKITKKDPNYGSLDELMAMAQKVVDENIDKDASDLKKIYQAFWWTKMNLEYTRDSDKSSWIGEAIRGFNEGRGDCFTFFAVLKALLNSMGYETIDVTRLGGETQHFWLLVKYEGQYYHIDACPRNPYRDKYWYCFLRTDAELQEWSPNYENYYNFDTSLYPATATEPLNLGSMQRGGD